MAFTNTNKINHNNYKNVKVLPRFYNKSFPIVWELRMQLAIVLLLNTICAFCVYFGINHSTPITIFGAVPSFLYSSFMCYKMEKTFNKLA